MYCCNKLFLYDGVTCNSQLINSKLQLSKILEQGLSLIFGQWGNEKQNSLGFYSVIALFFCQSSHRKFPPPCPYSKPCSNFLQWFSFFNFYSCQPCKLICLCCVFMQVSRSDVSSLDERLVALRANVGFKCCLNEKKKKTFVREKRETN